MADTVRLATKDEAPLVYEVMLAAYAEHMGVLPVESGAHTETVDDVVHDISRGGAVLAFDGERVVGSARFVYEGDEVYVWRLAVRPSHRRRGAASAIMRFVEAAAVAQGRRAIRIGVRESLPSNIRLYEALDYEVVPIEPHPRGPDRSVTMIKRLADTEITGVGDGA